MDRARRNTPTSGSPRARSADTYLFKVRSSASFPKKRWSKHSSKRPRRLPSKASKHVWPPVTRAPRPKRPPTGLYSWTTGAATRTTTANESKRFAGASPTNRLSLVFFHLAKENRGLTECPDPAGRRLSPLVPRRGGQSRDGRQRSGARHHGHSPVRLRHLGAHAVRSRRAHQGGRRAERLLPALHSAELLRARGPARRRLQSRTGRGHLRRRRRVGRAGGGASDVRDGRR